MFVFSLQEKLYYITKMLDFFGKEQIILDFCHENAIIMVSKGSGYEAGLQPMYPILTRWRYCLVECGNVKTPHLWGWIRGVEGYQSPILSNPTWVGISQWLKNERFPKHLKPHNCGDGDIWMDIIVTSCVGVWIEILLKLSVFFEISLCSERVGWNLLLILYPS